jgi:hypothetical protein
MLLNSNIIDTNGRSPFYSALLNNNNNKQICFFNGFSHLQWLVTLKYEDFSENWMEIV